MEKFTLPQFDQQIFNLKSIFQYNSPKNKFYTNIQKFLSINNPYESYERKWKTVQWKLINIFIRKSYSKYLY